jgi:hypothetical protein
LGDLLMEVKEALPGSGRFGNALSWQGLDRVPFSQGDPFLAKRILAIECGDHFATPTRCRQTGRSVLIACTAR